MQKLYPFQIDVPVLIIFFNRPEPLRQVFEQVKIARPSKLFLYQDGARGTRPDDLEKIKQCRAIVEDIDWECEVHRFYQTQNMGCDPSEFIAQKWVFGIVDRCIILEDDDVPSQSFFPFCKELLERYKDDTRINMICGMNNLEKYETDGSSYFFTTGGSIWGWASWRRVIEQWDEHYSFLDNTYIMKTLEKLDTAQGGKVFRDVCLRHKASGRAHYESIFGAARRLNGSVNIVPHLNLISNIGIQAESTHATEDIKLLPPRIRRLFSMKRYELIFPLKHPQAVINDLQYKEMLNSKASIGDIYWKLKRVLFHIKRKIGER